MFETTIREPDNRQPDSRGPAMAQSPVTSSAAASSSGAEDEVSEPWRTLRQVLDPTYPCPDSAASSVPGSADLGLMTLCRPLIVHSVHRLQRQLLDGRQPVSYDPETVLGLLVPDVVKRLGEIVMRSLVVEMHAARLAGRLSGTTPAERFESYVELLRSPVYAMEFFNEYPALAERAVSCCRRWEVFCREILERLELDFPELEERFGGARGLGRLCGILGQQGDLHNDGRKVVICELTCGTRIVYKPRSLCLDEHFQSLLRWFHQTDPEFSFRTLEILNRESYGWVEYAEYAECDGDAELGTFYFQLGGLLAILYTLQANDIHHENIIACGPHPVLVDLETLFHPIAFDYTLESEKYSLLEVGILPVDRGSDTHLSMSALGADRDQVCKIMGWNHIGTDEQCFEQRRGSLKRVTSQPRQGAETRLSRRSVQALLDGFRLAYRTISDNKRRFTGPGGLLDGFEGDTSRCVLRPTRIYQSLLWDQNHPARSGSSRRPGILRDQLALEVPVRPYLERALEAEAADLEQGDVPLFHCRPGATALLDCRGRSIPDFFPQGALEGVRRRVEGFCEADLQRQEWLIRQALADVDSDHASKVTRMPFQVGRAMAGQDSFLDMAQQIGDSFAAKAIRSGGRATWAGYHRVGDSFVMGYLPPKLYSGQLGILWFLAQLAEQTGDKKQRQLAQQGLAFFRQQQLDRLMLQGGIGAFDGLGGVVYVMAHLTHLWPEMDLSADIDRVLDRLQEQIPNDRALDVVSGSAGCLLALLGLHRATGSSRALDLAIQCGECLSSQVDDRDGEILWQSSQFEQPLTGFSHGLTGVALALARLSAFWRPQALRQHVSRLIALEDRYFDEARSNWRDLRPSTVEAQTGDGFMWAWCHGAPGIVAGRHALAAALPVALRRQILGPLDVLTPSLVRHGSSSENNLCHGVFGNLDLLLSVASAGGDDELRRACPSYMAGAIDSMLDGRSLGQWLGSSRRLDLMLGSAGIGYVLLRLAAMGEPPGLGSTVPSILLLDAPV